MLPPASVSVTAAGGIAWQCAVCDSPSPAAHTQCLACDAGQTEAIERAVAAAQASRGTGEAGRGRADEADDSVNESAVEEWANEAGEIAARGVRSDVSQKSEAEQERKCVHCLKVYKNEAARKVQSPCLAP